MYAKCSACPSSCRKVLQSVWPPCGRSTRYTSSGTRTGAQNARDRFPSRSPVSNVTAPARRRIDAHLAHLPCGSTPPSRRREVRVELPRAEQRRARRRASPRSARCRARASHELGKDFVPHRLRVAQELLALVAQPGERDAAQQLPRGVVVRRESERLGDVALALEPLASDRRQLALRRASPAPSRSPRARRGRCCSPSRSTPLERDLPPVGELHDGRRLPRDLALVERRELAARSATPPASRAAAAPSALLLAPLRRAHETPRASARARRGRGSSAMLRVDRLQLGGRLQPACAS